MRRPRRVWIPTIPPPAALQSGQRVPMAVHQNSSLSSALQLPPPGAANSRRFAAPSLQPPFFQPLTQFCALLKIPIFAAPRLFFASAGMLLISVVAAASDESAVAEVEFGAFAPIASRGSRTLATYAPVPGCPATLEISLKSSIRWTNHPPKLLESKMLPRKASQQTPWTGLK